MKNIEQLNDWQDDVRSGLRREIERLREKEEMLNSYMQLLDATSEFIDDMSDLTRELERSQAEVGSLSSELEEQQKESDSLLQQMKEEASSQRLEMQAEIDSLRKQLIEAKDLALASQEADAKPAEIHNHFEQGSSAQVFNDKVTGKFSKIRKWKQKEKREKRKMW